MRFQLPAVTKALLIACGIAYLLQLILGRALEPLMLWPLGVDGGPGRTFMPWQLLTYAFLHADFMHLFFNMLALVMFGAAIEHEWNSRKYSIYLAVCGVGAGLCQLAGGWWMVSRGVAPYGTVGASGGVFGLLLAFGLMFPNQRVAMLPFPIFVRARTLVVIYAVVELLAGLNGWQPGVAHFAHLGGMLFGWLLIMYWRRPRRRPPTKPSKPRPRHLRSVK